MLHLCVLEFTLEIWKGILDEIQNETWSSSKSEVCNTFGNNDFLHRPSNSICESIGGLLLDFCVRSLWLYCFPAFFWIYYENQFWEICNFTKESPIEARWKPYQDTIVGPHAFPCYASCSSASSEASTACHVLTFETWLNTGSPHEGMNVQGAQPVTLTVAGLNRTEQGMWGDVALWVILSHFP